MDQARIELIGVAEKAVADATTGDLMIEGWAARYNEPDRTQEYFMDNAFQRAVEQVAGGKVPLLYHHDPKMQLGQVLELEQKAEGVWMRALVPKPTEEWAVDIYDRLKRGLLKGLSAKGMFTKQLLPTGGARIRDVDLFEISASPVPVGAGATIEVVAQKAFPEIGHTEEEVRDALEGYFISRLDEARTAFQAIEDALEGRS